MNAINVALPDGRHATVQPLVGGTYQNGPDAAREIGNARWTRLLLDNARARLIEAAEDYVAAAVARLDRFIEGEEDAGVPDLTGLDVLAARIEDLSQDVLVMAEETADAAGVPMRNVAGRTQV